MKKDILIKNGAAFILLLNAISAASALPMRQFKTQANNTQANNSQSTATASAAILQNNTVIYLLSEPSQYLSVAPKTYAISTTTNTQNAVPLLVNTIAPTQVDAPWTYIFKIANNGMYLGTTPDCKLQFQPTATYFSLSHSSNGYHYLSSNNTCTIPVIIEQSNYPATAA